MLRRPRGIFRQCVKKQGMHNYCTFLLHDLAMRSANALSSRLCVRSARTETVDSGRLANHLSTWQCGSLFFYVKSGNECMKFGIGEQLDRTQCSQLLGTGCRVAVVPVCMQQTANIPRLIACVRHKPWSCEGSGMHCRGCQCLL